MTFEISYEGLYYKAFYTSNKNYEVEIQSVCHFLEQIDKIIIIILFLI